MVSNAVAVACKLRIPARTERHNARHAARRTAPVQVAFYFATMLCLHIYTYIQLQAFTMSLHTTKYTLLRCDAVLIYVIISSYVLLPDSFDDVNIQIKIS